MMNNSDFDYVIVMPCYNESGTIINFLDELEGTLGKIYKKFLVIVVDDASIDDTLELLTRYRFTQENIFLKIVTLPYNLGHQKAIYQGLSFAKKFKASRYIVLDSDGEDDPEAIIELVELQKDIVFVTRGKRRESLLFRISYFFYRIIFKILTGKSLNFGNYSMISKRVLDAVVGSNFIHYPGFLSKLRFPNERIKFDRRKRLDGVSKMNYQRLIFHGLSSLVEYADELLLFFMRLFLLSLVSVVGFGLNILYQKFFSHEAILGWASTLGGTLVNSCLIILGIIVLGLLLLNLKERDKEKSDIYREVK